MPKDTLDNENLWFLDALASLDLMIVTDKLPKWQFTILYYPFTIHEIMTPIDWIDWIIDWIDWIYGIHWIHWIYWMNWIYWNARKTKN